MSPSSKRLRAVIILPLASLWLAGCGGGRRATVPAPEPVEERTGIASWYGRPHDGRPTANGEIFDMEKLTAAHRTLPFGTLVRVRNLDNGKTVDVRINDRGPFVSGRIIDLSRAAAQRLGMLASGTARVELTVLVPDPGHAGAAYAVQVGAFRVRAYAERLRAAMEERYGEARLAPLPGVYRVLVGRLSDLESARSLARRIRAEGGDLAAAFVIRLDEP